MSGKGPLPVIGLRDAAIGVALGTILGGLIVLRIVSL